MSSCQSLLALLMLQVSKWPSIEKAIAPRDTYAGSASSRSLL